MTNRKYADDIPCPLCQRAGKIFVDEIVQDLVSMSIHVGLKCDYDDCSFLARIDA